MNRQLMRCPTRLPFGAKVAVVWRWLVEGETLFSRCRSAAEPPMEVPPALCLPGSFG